MSVKIRLMRVGKRKQPSYRVVVADERQARDGRIIETIGNYGPRQDPRGPYAAAVPRFLEAALAGSPLTIHGDGRQTRDFVYVDDIASSFGRFDAAHHEPSCRDSGQHPASSRADRLDRE